MFILPVSADEIAQDSASSSEPTLVSSIVYPEVTDPEELLEMAMEQEPAPMTRSAVAPQNDEITVTQLLEEQTYSDGSVKKLYAQTALLVLDDEGNKMSRSAYDHFYRVAGNSLGNVFASQTLYVEADYDSIRITHVTTTISSTGIATPVTRFVHAITVNDPAQEPIIQQQTVYSPHMDTPYTFYNPDPTYYFRGSLSLTMQTGAVIYLSDGRSFEVINAIVDTLRPGILY